MRANGWMFLALVGCGGHHLDARAAAAEPLRAANRDECREVVAHMRELAPQLGKVGDDELVRDCEDGVSNKALPCILDARAFDDIGQCIAADPPPGQEMQAPYTPPTSGAGSLVGTWSDDGTVGEVQVKPDGGLTLARARVAPDGARDETSAGCDQAAEAVQCRDSGEWMSIGAHEFSVTMSMLVVEELADARGVKHQRCRCDPDSVLTVDVVVSADGTTANIYADQSHDASRTIQFTRAAQP